MTERNTTISSRNEAANTALSSNGSVSANCGSPGRAYVDPVHRGPFTRWPRAADAVLAAVLFVLTLLLTDGAGDSVVLRDVGAVPLWSVLLLAVAVAGAAVTDPAHRACLERHTRAWARSRPAVARMVRGQVHAARRMKARSSSSSPMERP